MVKIHPPLQVAGNPQPLLKNLENHRQWDAGGQMDPKLLEAMQLTLQAMAQSKKSSPDWAKQDLTDGPVPFDPQAAWKSYKAWLKMIGAVPLVEYKALETKYRRLKAQCDQQKASMEALESMVSASEGLQKNFFENLTHCADQQGRLINEMFENLLTKSEDDGNTPPEDQS